MKCDQPTVMGKCDSWIPTVMGKCDSWVPTAMGIHQLTCSTIHNPQSTHPQSTVLWFYTFRTGLSTLLIPNTRQYQGFTGNTAVQNKEITQNKYFDQHVTSKQW